MEKEKIKFLKRYYCFDPNIPDSEIIDKLGDSLGSFVFEIKKAKREFAKAILDSFPGLKKINKVAPKIWQDQPTGDGFWWLRDNKHDKRPEVVDVEHGVYYELGGVKKYVADNKYGKWYGPITPPKED